MEGLSLDISLSKMPKEVNRDIRPLHFRIAKDGKATHLTFFSASYTLLIFSA